MRHLAHWLVVAGFVLMIGVGCAVAMIIMEDGPAWVLRTYPAAVAEAARVVAEVQAWPRWVQLAVTFTGGAGLALLGLLLEVGVAGAAGFDDRLDDMHRVMTHHQDDEEGRR